VSMSKKRLGMIGSGIAVLAVIAGGTIAYATFNRSGTASADGTASETFAPLSVQGEWLGRSGGGAKLLPGESGDVRVTLTNPASNTVQGKVRGIVPIALDPNSIGGIPDDVKPACKNWLHFATFTPAAGANPVLSNNGIGKAIILKDAVKLDVEATESCSGMTFPTSFTVNFEATRDSLYDVATLTPTSY